MCGPPDVEPDDISEANSQNYFAIGVPEDKENIEIFPTDNATNDLLKLELKLHTVVKIINLLCQEVVYFVKLHIYWLENLMNFTGPRQKNKISRASVLQPKSLHFLYFTLKVPFFPSIFFVDCEWKLFYCGINSVTSFIRIL